MTARQTLESALTGVLPEGWRLVPVGTSLDTLDRPVVMLHQASIEAAPQAPAGAYVVSYTITLINHLQDETAAELALDGDVLDLLSHLEDLPFLNVKRAEKVFFQNTNLAYDITAEVVTRKDA